MPFKPQVLHTCGLLAALENILCGNLEESRIRRVILELLCGDDITASRIHTRVGWTVPGGMIQKIKGVCTKLYVLLPPGFEVFEAGHVDPLKSRPVDLV